MKYRLDLLKIHNLGLADIQKVISDMGPMVGAKDFLDALRCDYQVIILSDTFYEFAIPLMGQLGMPVLFCHKLEVDAAGILFHPPQNVIDEFPQFPVTMDYLQLRTEIDKAAARIE
jgi:phosphoserine/homoserine phosphotransferase